MLNLKHTYQPKEDLFAGRTEIHIMLRYELIFFEEE